MGENIKKQYPCVDVTKFVLSMLVAILHIFGSIGQVEAVFPFVHIAVPTFFIFTGFLYFKKWNSDASLKRTYLPFLKRNVILFAIWSVILFPMWYRVYAIQSGNGILRNVLSIVKMFWGRGTFLTSWYILACIIGIFILSILSKKCNNIVLIVIGAAAYFLCLATTNYTGLFGEDSLFIRICFDYYPGSLDMTFPRGLLFLAIGKIIAEHDINDKSKRYFILFVLSLIALFMEDRLVDYMQWRSNNTCSCFISLVPCTVFLVLWAISCPINIPYARDMRSISTINYLAHNELAYVLLPCIRAIFGSTTVMGWQSVVLFVIVEVIVISLSILVLKVEKYKRFAFLKYLH